MKSQKKPLLGIIQGRLSPPIRGQYQAFPKEWRKEFELAAKLGISYIEWLIKDFCYDFNPLWSEQGRSEILKVSKATGVKINHICGDAFMASPLVGRTGELNVTAIEVLERLITISGEMCIESVMIPFVDAGAFNSQLQKNRTIEVLQSIAEKVAPHSTTRIVFESEEPCGDVKAIFEKLGLTRFGMTYDTGDRTSLGFDCSSEIRAFGDIIGNIHIKDRLIGGMTVPLGTGAVDFNEAFAALKEIGYCRSVVLQPARGYFPVEDIRKCVEFVEHASDGWIDRSAVRNLKKVKAHRSVGIG